MKGGVDLFKIIKVLGRFRALYDPISISQISVFLLVGNSGTLKQSDAKRTLGMTDSLVSRCVHTLRAGKKSGLKTPLIKADIDPENQRERILTLTPLGRQLMEDIRRDIS